MIKLKEKLFGYYKMFESGVEYQGVGVEYDIIDVLFKKGFMIKIKEKFFGYYFIVLVFIIIDV